MDARFEQHLDVYESHGASFEDSATITRAFCMTRPYLQTEQGIAPNPVSGAARQVV
jgi:hypothetical protein